MRLRKGQLVAVRFLDHLECSDQPYDFTVYGRLLSIAPDSLTVGCWTYTDGKENRNLTDTNLKCFTIVRSAIKSVMHLEARNG